jgi:hypothetical protein
MSGCPTDARVPHPWHVFVLVPRVGRHNPERIAVNTPYISQNFLPTGIPFIPHTLTINNTTKINRPNFAYNYPPKAHNLNQNVFDSGNSSVPRP